MKSPRKVFDKNIIHSKSIHLRRGTNNNKMKKINGEIWDRKKVYRDLKRIDMPMIDGMSVYYNFTWWVER